MKKYFFQTGFLFCWLIISFHLTAQVTNNFNTRPEAPSISAVKPNLQDHCWYLPGMNVNYNNWDPQIEGNGGLVSIPNADLNGSTGIYSPFLDVPGSIQLSFKYKFSDNVTERRWLRVLLVNQNNEPFQLLDCSELTGKAINTIYTYQNSFNNLPSGAFKLFINYQGINGNISIAIDELNISCPLLYLGGCNHAPVAVADHITGNIHHSASGSVCLNDYDPDGNYFTAYVISNSNDGQVSMDSDGSFTFTPNVGFSGSSTSFSYQICDNGFGPLCSEVTTATINFPSEGMLPAKLIDFTANVNDNSEVNIRWTTTFEQSTDRFEIERSFDGNIYETIGRIKAAGTSPKQNNYLFNDKLKSSLTSRKDVYYRLRMVDVNSRVEVSKVLVIRLFKTRSLKMVSITPNPVRNDINVIVQLKDNSYITLKINNSNGSEVLRKSIRGYTGMNVYSLDGTGSLVPGIYMLEVTINSNERMTAKLIKN